LLKARSSYCVFWQFYNQVGIAGGKEKLILGERIPIALGCCPGFGGICGSWAGKLGSVGCAFSGLVRF